MLTLLDGKYTVLNTLKHKEFTDVFVVENIRTKCKFIIKRTLKIISDHNESRLLLNLKHPGLPDIYDIFEDNDYFYMVEELVQGHNLNEFINENGFMEEEEALIFWLKCCEILEYIHSFSPAPIVHRDIKPSNIMIENSGRVVLLDFDISREINESEAFETRALGTPFYASPEQYHGKEVSVYSDIYSLAKTVIYSLSGKSIESLSKKELLKGFSSRVSKLLEDCLTEDPRCRPNSSQLKKRILKEIKNHKAPKSFLHKFFSKNKNLYKGIKRSVLLSGIPSSGVTSISVGLSEFFRDKGYTVSLIECREDKKLFYSFEALAQNINQDNMNNWISFHPDKKRSIIIKNSIFQNIEMFRQILFQWREEADICIFCTELNQFEQFYSHMDVSFVIKDNDVNSFEAYSSCLKSLSDRGMKGNNLYLVLNKFISNTLERKTYERAVGWNGTPSFIIPFDIKNMSWAIGCYSKGFLNCKGYSQEFHKGIEKIGRCIIPWGEDI